VSGSGLNRRGWCGLALATLIVLVSFTPQFRSAMAFPSSLRLSVGERHSLHLNLPLPASVRLRKGTGLKLNNHWLTAKPAAINLTGPLTLESIRPGQSEMEFLLFGIPWKRVVVNAQVPKKVIPGGHAIGVLLTSRGLIVVGHNSVVRVAGRARSPGWEAGIAVGDLLLEADGNQLVTVGDLAEAVDKAGREGRSLKLKLKRGSEILEVEVRPVLTAGNRYRIGLFVRDGANGVGTLSFYDPETGFYGALGHIITDPDTGTPLTIREGSIVKAFISSITAGIRGRPGEKIGVFQPEETAWGNISANTEFGIFGQLNAPLSNPYFPQAIPVALVSEVHPGPAEMYTVLERDRIERFQVEIERVNNQVTPSDKGLILRITDPVLLKKSGGIIQGMSGSPIIQDGKLAGIVTHVFVNDPSRGFGVLAEWMLEKSIIISRGTVSVPYFLTLVRIFLPFEEDYGKGLSNMS
jgi:stage IV sporulation protein B